MQQLQKQKQKTYKIYNSYRRKRWKQHRSLDRMGYYLTRLLVEQDLMVPLVKRLPQLAQVNFEEEDQRSIDPLYQTAYRGSNSLLYENEGGVLLIHGFAESRERIHAPEKMSVVYPKYIEFQSYTSCSSGIFRTGVLFYIYILILYTVRTRYQVPSTISEFNLI